MSAAQARARREPTRHVVCRADEIAPGAAKRFEIEGREIAVFNVNGEFAAISDRCPHEGASLCKGKIVGLAQSDEPGQYRIEREGEFVRCPWHGWEFDLKTGRSWCDPARTRVKSYDVSVAGGAQLVEGPYRIETYEVSREGEYVVVSI
jgi:nitrite reductase/ring-hydroxylating ferredoxin subunit